MCISCCVVLLSFPPPSQVLAHYSKSCFAYIGLWLGLVLYILLQVMESVVLWVIHMYEWVKRCPILALETNSVVLWIS